MNKIFEQAEKEMQELRQPYVGSHHLFLAYLKSNENNIINYEQFKKIITRVIGSCKSKSEKIIYTPYMRKISKSNINTTEIIKNIINDDNSITHNLLINEKIDINKIVESL